MSKSLYHYTNAEAAKSILKSHEFRPSRILTCNDPLEMDNFPCYLDFSKDAQHKWYCRELYQLYKDKNPLFSQRLKTHLDQLNEAERLNFSNIIYNDHKKKMTKDKLLLFTEEISGLKYLREMSYIYCFSEANIKTNILQWAHYAAKHSGIALEFNFPTYEFGKQLHKVIYSKNNIRGGVFNPKEIINLFKNYNTDISTQRKYFEKTVLTKHKDWEYEQEWRLISEVKNIEIKPSMRISDEIISSIYFGMKISHEDKDELINLVRNQYPKTKIFLGKKSDKYIRLDFEELLIAS